jgi:outer membrane protein TolC
MTTLIPLPSLRHSALAALLLCTAHATAAPVLTLQEYVSQVTQLNQGYRGAKDAATGAELRAQEGSLLLKPFVYSTVNFRDDEIPTMAPSFMGTRTLTRTYNLGFRQQTSFGLGADLSYNLMYQDIKNAPFVPEPKVYTAYPSITLTQSLWRNFFGNETRANQRMLEAGAMTNVYIENFKALQIRLEAETSYWMLALAKETVQTQRDVFSRAQKILEWAERRSNLNLADRSDVLQAKAALEVRRLELQIALDDEKSAANRFNMARNREGWDVDAELQKVDPAQLRGLKAPPRKALRDDVKAAEQNEKMVEANTDLALNRHSPTLEVFGSYALNSTRATQVSSAFSSSFDPQFPTSQIGLRFSANLDLWGISDARAGYKRERVGAQRTFQRKLFEQEREWSDLTRRLNEGQRRLELALELEKAQKEKLSYEKQRFNRGRTTTYQVLLFEQDYAQAQMGRIRAEADVLRTLSQMKLFGGTES